MPTDDEILDAEDALREAEEGDDRALQAERAAALSALRRAWLRETPDDDDREAGTRRLRLKREARTLIAEADRG